MKQSEQVKKVITRREEAEKGDDMPATKGYGILPTEDYYILYSKNRQSCFIRYNNKQNAEEHIKYLEHDKQSNFICVIKGRCLDIKITKEFIVAGVNIIDEEKENKLFEQEKF